MCQVGLKRSLIWTAGLEARGYCVGGNTRRLWYKPRPAVVIQ